MEVKVSLILWPDLLAFSVLLMLSVYHFMIFWGRKRDQKEKYNLYFAWFVFSVALFIISPYFQKGYFLNSLKPNWLYAINIEMLTIWLMVVCGTNFLNHLLEVSSKFKQYFRFTFISITLCLLLTLTSNFIGLSFYFKHVLPILLVIIAINVLLINCLYGHWLHRNGLYKVRFIRILFFGYLFLTINILVYRSFELIHFSSILWHNHYLTIIILYVFTYALTVKFNKEHDELYELKQNLELRISEQAEYLVSTYRRLAENYKRPTIIIPAKSVPLSNDDQFLSKALQIIEKNMDDTSFSTEKFSEEIGISRAHLHRRLKALTMQSATEFIRTIRLKRAAELLNLKTASVSEIAYTTGFNNLSYFTRCFKEEFGVVPSEYFSKSYQYSKPSEIFMQEA